MEMAWNLERMEAVFLVLYPAATYSSVNVRYQKITFRFGDLRLLDSQKTSFVKEDPGTYESHHGVRYQDLQIQRRDLMRLCLHFHSGTWRQYQECFSRE